MAEITKSDQKSAYQARARTSEWVNMILGSLTGVIIGFTAGVGAMGSNKSVLADWKSAQHAPGAAMSDGPRNLDLASR